MYSCEYGTKSRNILETLLSVSHGHAGSSKGKKEEPMCQQQGVEAKLMYKIFSHC